jgi:hypothetical protein
MNNIQKDIFNELLSVSIKKKDYYLKNLNNYYALLDKSSAKIQGKTIYSIYFPYVLSDNDYTYIKNKAEKLWLILEKTAELIVTEREVAGYFDFPEEFLDLLTVEPGYSINIPITRFDAFYHGDNIFYCEFNTDGTSGMNETNTMEEAYFATEIGKELQEKYSLKQFELRKSLLTTLLECYKEYKENTGFRNKDTEYKEHAHRPNIAIVDFMDKATIAEFEALRETFIQCGYNTMICDPRDLIYRDGRLFHGNYRIDLVYRRAVTTEILERTDKVKAFLQAYKDNAFCMVGSFRSEAAHSKLVFTFLSSKSAKKYFNAHELKIIMEHIPFTFKLTSNNEELINELIHKKDSYLIKPHNSYGSQGLYMGKDYTQNEWENLVQSNKDANYIAQKVVEIPQEDFVVTPGKIKKLRVNLSPYLYNGKLAGFYTRVSNIDIITTARGGALVPTFLACEE